MIDYLESSFQVTTSLNNVSDPGESVGWVGGDRARQVLPVSGHSLIQQVMCNWYHLGWQVRSYWGSGRETFRLTVRTSVWSFNVIDILRCMIFYKEPGKSYLRNSGYSIIFRNWDFRFSKNLGNRHKHHDTCHVFVDFMELRRNQKIKSLSRYPTSKTNGRWIDGRLINWCFDSR